MVIYLVRLSIWGIVFCLWHREAFEDIHYQAVCAAGNWEVDAAWSHIASLATTELTDKSLRLAAIEAVGNIRPQEAAELLLELTQSDDQDIVDAAYEAMAMSGWFPDEDYDDDDEDERVLHLLFCI